MTTAAEALRVARAQAIHLWVVNADLPDLSGAALCEMLKSHTPRSPVLMMADRYSPADERAALAARATAFLVKPLHDDWLADWISTLSIPANTGPA